MLLKCNRVDLRTNKYQAQHTKNQFVGEGTRVTLTRYL